MRLLDARTFEFKQVSDPRNIPKYAVLSHTWGDNEVVYSDLISSFLEASQRPEFAKVIYTAQQALKDGLDYIWIDTCTIDKSSSADLSESINSMYKIYKNAQVCYVYLADVFEPPPDSWTDDGEDDHEWTRAFVGARWFTRGWTLQELIAPRNNVFYTSDWRHIGTKRELCQTIARHTGISTPILLGARLSRTLVAERMQWAAKRTTTREEDIAYCLLGIFDINMPLLYGEGERAFLRLQHEIIKKTNDRSIFLWSATQTSHTSFRSLFAQSPAEFASFTAYNISTKFGLFEMTQQGLKIEVPLIEVPGSNGPEFFAVILEAGESFHCVRLRKISPTEYARVDADEVLVLLNPNYVRFSSRTPHEKAELITVPNTFDDFERDAYIDYRLGGFKVEYHPIELTIQSVEPSGAWDAETQTLVLDFSQDHDCVSNPGLKMVFAEVSHPETTYEIDLVDRMRAPGGFSIWGPSPSNNKIGYLVSMRKRFEDDKMMHVIRINYQIFQDDGWMISADKNPLPGRCTYYRTITAEESDAFMSVLRKEEEEEEEEEEEGENKEDNKRAIEEGSSSAMSANDFGPSSDIERGTTNPEGDEGAGSTEAVDDGSKSTGDTEVHDGF